MASSEEATLEDCQEASEARLAVGEEASPAATEEEAKCQQILIIGMAEVAKVMPGLEIPEEAIRGVGIPEVEEEVTFGLEILEEAMDGQETPEEAVTQAMVAAMTPTAPEIIKAE